MYITWLGLFIVALAHILGLFIVALAHILDKRTKIEKVWSS